MDSFLTEVAVRRLLREKKDYPTTLEQISGKHIIFEILNIMKICAQNDELCYCHKFFGCAPHFYSDKYYICEVCQFCTDYCPCVLEKKGAVDARYLLPRIFLRENSPSLKTLLKKIGSFLNLDIDIHFLWAVWLHNPLP